MSASLTAAGAAESEEGARSFSAQALRSLRLCGEAWLEVCKPTSLKLNKRLINFRLHRNQSGAVRSKAKFINAQLLVPKLKLSRSPKIASKKLRF